eukprot:4601123-Amphidinium_carterae.1
MELLIVLVPDADVRARADDTVNLGRDPNSIRIVPDAAAIAFARNQLENEIRARHRRAFPIGENVQALMMIVMADLKEQQRELLMATMFKRNNGQKPRHLRSFGVYLVTPNFRLALPTARLTEMSRASILSCTPSS